MSDRVPTLRKFAKTLNVNPDAVCEITADESNLSQSAQNVDDLPKELQGLASATRDLCDALKKL